METSGYTASRGEERAPKALWVALLLAAIPQLYLSAPGGDEARYTVLPWLFLALFAYLLIVRRSRVAWWFLMVGTVAEFYLDATSDDFDTYVVISAVTCIGTVVGLSLPQTRDWVRLWR